jgi:hyperosmotically inducible protein
MSPTARVQITHRDVGQVRLQRSLRPGKKGVIGNRDGEEAMMKSVFTGLLVAGMLAGSVALAQDADVDRSHPKAFVKDSVITTKIKSKLAADHITSVGRIHVDTDADGVVWLSGSAHTQDAIDHAVSVAKSTEGVKDVRNSLKVRADD